MKATAKQRPCTGHGSRGSSGHLRKATTIAVPRVQCVFLQRFSKETEPYFIVQKGAVFMHPIFYDLGTIIRLPLKNDGLLY